MRLEDLQPNAALRGALPDAPVTVVRAASGPGHRPSGTANVIAGSATLRAEVEAEFGHP